jgi:hypothetical protein
LRAICAQASLRGVQVSFGIDWPSPPAVGAQAGRTLQPPAGIANMTLGASTMSAGRQATLSREASTAQLCSALVDLVECVGHHRRGGHRFALAGERFVSLVGKDTAEVRSRW